MPEQGYKFRDVGKVAKVIKYLLIAAIILDILGVIFGVVEYRLFQEVAAFEEIAEKDESIYDSTEYNSVFESVEANDVRIVSLGFAMILIYLMTVILVLRWTFLSNSNAHALGAKDMRFTPFWSVLWHFIPLFSLWKPYQVMREIYKASSLEEDWKSLKTPALLKWWWIFWIVASVLGQILFRTAMNAESLDQFMEVNKLGLVADSLDIPLCLIFMIVVKRITAIQMAAKK